MCWVCEVNLKANKINIGWCQNASVRLREVSLGVRGLWWMQYAVLIDVAGLNPFDLDQLDDLAALADASDGEIVAVLDAGMTPGDAEDAAALFSSIGAGRVIATKLDIARRLGALLAFGEAGLAYAQISASPYIGDGLAPATALR